jgi:acylphosphatase
MAELAGLSATVHGRVQGVFFRAFVADVAARMGLAGYARNLPDGPVQVEAEGDREKLQQLSQHLRIGPSAARVVRVDVSWSEFRGRFSGFRTL